MMARTADIKGVKRADVQKCIQCNQGVMHDNNLIFYTLDIRHMVADIGSLQRAHGMEMMMGGGQDGALLASIMGPDEDIAKELSHHSVWVCLECSMAHPLGALIETADRNAEEEDNG